MAVGTIILHGVKIKFDGVETTHPHHGIQCRIGNATLEHLLKVRDQTRKAPPRGGIHHHVVAQTDYFSSILTVTTRRGGDYHDVLVLKLQ